MSISPRNKNTIKNFLFKQNNNLKKGDLVRLAYGGDGNDSDNGSLHLCVSDAYRGHPARLLIDYATFVGDWMKDALKRKVWVVDVKALQGEGPGGGAEETGETYSILTCAVVKAKEM